jgi:hypothetical protein
MENGSLLIDETKARYYGWSVVFASWLAVFCLFGYRATCSIYFALGSFLFSILLATTLPLRVEYTKLRTREQGIQERLIWI